jgi:hypothetical protein
MPPVLLHSFLRIDWIPIFFIVNLAIVLSSPSPFSSPPHRLLFLLELPPRENNMISQGMDLEVQRTVTEDLKRSKGGIRKR